MKAQNQQDVNPGEKKFLLYKTLIGRARRQTQQRASVRPCAVGALANLVPIAIGIGSFGSSQKNEKKIKLI